MSSSPAGVDSAAQPANEIRAFTLRERFLLSVITWAGYLAIGLIGSTLRYSISWEDESLAPNAPFEKPCVYSFWHRSLFPAAWIYSNQGLAVLISRSFDGEFITRIIRKLGFTVVRGSSSRGGVGGSLGILSELARGSAVALTIDGPRGPKYVAKPGPARLAKMSGKPMMGFHVALSDAWVLKTWDEFMIPKPFSRALVRFSRKILVPADADDAQMADCHAQLQAALDRVTEFAEENVARVGSPEFPKRRR